MSSRQPRKSRKALEVEQAAAEEAAEKGIYGRLTTARLLRERREREEEEEEEEEWGGPEEPHQHENEKYRYMEPPQQKQPRKRRSSTMLRETPGPESIPDTPAAQRLYRVPGTPQTLRLNPPKSS